MKLTAKETLSNQIFKENEDEVLKFLAKVAPDKTEFRNEYTFLNFLARRLEPLLKKKARNCEKQATYWKNLWKATYRKSLSIDNALNLNSKFSLEELQERFETSQQDAMFWWSRAISMDKNYQINKAKNILWCIKLLDGQCGAPK